MDSNIESNGLNHVDYPERRFAGLDLSLTGTGVVLINSEGTIVETKLIQTNSKTDIEDRFDIILSGISIIWSYGYVHDVFIEGLSFGSRGHSMLQLAGLHYFIRHFIRDLVKLNIVKQYSIISPSTLKKFATGKGHSPKEVMLLHCYKNYGVEFTDNNLCDSYLLARMALADFKSEGS